MGPIFFGAYDKIVIPRTIEMVRKIKVIGVRLGYFILGLSKNQPSKVTLKLLGGSRGFLSAPTKVDWKKYFNSGRDHEVYTSSWRSSLTQAGEELLFSRLKYWSKMQVVAFCVQILSLGFWAGSSLVRSLYKISYLWILPSIALISLSTTALLLVFTFARADDVVESKKSNENPLAYGVAAIGGVGFIPSYIIAQEQLLRDKSKKSESLEKIYQTRGNLFEYIDYDAWFANQNLSVKERDTFKALLPGFNSSLDELVETVKLLERK